MVADTGLFLVKLSRNKIKHFYHIDQYLIFYLHKWYNLLLQVTYAKDIHIERLKLVFYILFNS